MAEGRQLVATELVTPRLVLTPLEVADAPDMVPVLGDPALYVHTGGAPPSLDELQDRYRRQVEGPSPPGETWLNWVVRLSEGVPIGYVQATVTEQVADLAWVIDTSRQGHGYAGEAARAMVEWLSSRRILLTAHVAPGHTASERVAAGVGMQPSGTFDDDGEQIWRLQGGGPT